MQKSLLLFIILLCTLTISVYFSNATLRVTEKMTDTEISELEAAILAAINASRQHTNATTPVATTSAATTPHATTPHATTGSGQDNGQGYGGVGGQSQNTNPVSNYYNWLAFWNNVANSNDPNSLFMSSNYIPKTAIVPPVCPNCPKCNNFSNSNTGSGSVCTSCGGQGGSGTSSSYKNKFSDFLALYGSGYNGNGSWGNAVNAVNGVNAGNAGNGDRGKGPGLGRLAEEAGSGVVDVTKTALNDATGLAAGAGSGAVGLLKDTGSGAVGLLRDTGSGAVGLLRDTGSGVASLLQSNPTQLSNNGVTQSSQMGTNAVYQSNNPNPYQSGYYSQGTYSLPNQPLGIQGIDPYSYNGALVSKGSNFIPITDDFSSFRK